MIMRDERVYHEYANWKIENNDLKSSLHKASNDLTLQLQQKDNVDSLKQVMQKMVEDKESVDE